MPGNLSCRNRNGFRRGIVNLFSALVVAGGGLFAGAIFRRVFRCQQKLKELEYAPMVLSEALRLYPPAWTIARNVINDDVVCDYRVPGGSFVLLSPFITQRLESFWPDPERFYPQRFTAEKVRGRHRFAWFPFSAGPRVCIGRQFSMLEDQLILAQVMREFRVNVDSKTVGFKAEGTLHPDRSVHIRVERR